jgi:cysteine desulfurase
MARKSRQNLDKNKSKIAGILGVKSSDLIITSGGSESNNLAIRGVMENSAGGELLIGAVEHESVIKPAAKFSHKVIPVDKNGIIKLEQIEKLVSDKTVLISVMLANNEVGAVQPIKELSELIDKILQKRREKGIATPLLLHSDCCQAPLYLDLHPHRLGLDLMTLNGGKIYGPKSSGFLFVKPTVKLQPIILGGGQQRGLRSGTENLANVAGLAAALELAAKNRAAEVKRLSHLQTYFFEKLTKEIPSVIINGPQKKRLPNNIHISLPGADNERLIYELDEAGIMVAAGSACSASSDEPSHVLSAMGISDKLARASLRMTMGRDTNKKDIDLVVKALKRIYNS